MTKKQNEKKKKSPFREWLDALIFAVVVASIIRWLLFEPFMIPTSSMENSLLRGDFLFVSKIHYGARSPQTPLQIPLTFQHIWFTKIPSYLENISIPMFRLPGFSAVKRNDAVVFNYPAELERPVDMRTYYIKRCIGLPGERLAMQDKQVLINGEAIENIGKQQTSFYLKPKKIINNPDKILSRQGIIDMSVDTENQSYIVYTNPEKVRAFNNSSFFYPPVEIKDKGGFYPNTRQRFFLKSQTLDEALLQKYGVADIEKTAQGYYINILRDKAERLRQKGFFQQVDTVQLIDSTYRENQSISWTIDNFGPLYIPKKQATIALNEKNIHTYRDLILYYEGNKDITYLQGRLLQNGDTLINYTFKKDYYFMMGDNRHNSADSRVWGFVPADHIVGKAVVVWWSFEQQGNLLDIFSRIRWKRIMSLVE